jgi:ribosomal protein S18 acetylase RimI-like enzyme
VLLRTLVEGLTQSAVLLSTPEGDTRAWRLYRSVGFVDLIRDHLFPGDSRPFAVLGCRMPLPPDA